MVSMKQLVKPPVSRNFDQNKFCICPSRASVSSEVGTRVTLALPPILNKFFEAQHLVAGMVCH